MTISDRCIIHESELKFPSTPENQPIIQCDRPSHADVTHHSRCIIDKYYSLNTTNEEDDSSDDRSRKYHNNPYYYKGFTHSYSRPFNESLQSEYVRQARESPKPETIKDTHGYENNSNPQLFQKYFSKNKTYIQTLNAPEVRKNWIRNKLSTNQAMKHGISSQSKSVTQMNDSLYPFSSMLKSIHFLPVIEVTHFKANSSDTDKRKRFISSGHEIDGFVQRGPEEITLIPEFTKQRENESGISSSYTEASKRGSSGGGSKKRSNQRQVGGKTSDLEEGSRRREKRLAIERRSEEDKDLCLCVLESRCSRECGK